MVAFRRGQRIIRHDGLTATFVRYTQVAGNIVVRYDDDTTPERVAWESDFSVSATHPAEAARLPSATQTEGEENG